MKNYILAAIVSVGFLTHVTAQTVVNDSVSLGPGYVFESFYSLASGETANVPATNWDIAINNNSFSVSVRVNSGNGVQLYNLQNSDTSQWSTIDTSGMAPIYDSDTSWDIGAFNAFATGHPNYGWAYYEGAGNLTGIKVFAMKLADGTFKKIWIKRLTLLVMEIAIGDLDNANEYTVMIDKGNYNSKAFVYYSIADQQVVDQEPVKESWDLVFRRYAVELEPSTYYTVTGAMTNDGVTSAEARGIPIDQADAASATFETNISVIGHDWKDFDMNIFQWVLEDSLSYFVKDQSGNVYHMVFTGFGGTGNGNINFSKTLVPVATSIQSIAPALPSISIYPNPFTDHVNLLIDSDLREEVNIRLTDLAGRVILNRDVMLASGLNNFRLDPSNYDSGTYIIQITTGSGQALRQIVKH